jgi:hypothetical protein
MTDPRRGAALLGFGFTVLLLAAGCAASPTPADTSAPSDAPAAAPANDGDEPLPVLPIGCADIFALPALQDSFATVLRVWDDETTTPRGMPLLQFRQAGGLACVWGGQEGTDGVPDGGLRLWISPDGVNEFKDYGTGTIPGDGETLEVDTVGDNSVITCGSPQYTGLHCSADVLVGDYWILAKASDTNTDLSHEDAVASFSGMLSTIADAVAGAGAPRPVWSPPADALDGAQLCSDATVAEYALGVDPGTVTSEPLSSDYQYDEFRAVSARAAGSGCAWSLPDGANVRITTLQGGAWAFARLQADGIGASMPTPGDVASVPSENVDGELIGCGDGCQALFLYKGSLIAVDNIDPPVVDATSKADAMAAALNAVY